MNEKIIKVKILEEDSMDMEDLVFHVAFKSKRKIRSGEIVHEIHRANNNLNRDDFRCKEQYAEAVLKFAADALESSWEYIDPDGTVAIFC